MKKLFTALFVGCLAFQVQAQTEIYSTEFTSTTDLPQGWERPNGQIDGWRIEDGRNNASPNPPFSGGGQIVLRNVDPADNPPSPIVGTYSIQTPAFNVSNFMDLKISWAARRTRQFDPQPLTVEYSLNGNAGPWTAITYTDRVNDGTWGLVEANLPAAASHQGSLTIRYTATTKDGGGTYRIDDFRLEGELHSSLPSLSGQNNIKVFSTENGLMINSPLATTFQLKDVLGRSVGTFQINQGSNTYSLPATKGIYWVVLKTQGQNQLHKVVLK